MAENIKYGGKVLRKEIMKLIKDILLQERMPEVWRKSMIVPWYKEGEIKECKNYTGLTLLDVIYKIMATILKKRLDKLSETRQIIGDYQCGFRKGRSTTDQILLLKQSLIQRYQYNKPTHLLFVDFKSAYDSVHRRKMLKVLEKFDIPGKLIRLEQTSLG